MGQNCCRATPTDQDEENSSVDESQGQGMEAKDLTRLERPETPMFSQNVLLSEQEERETAILMLQRLLRGCANQALREELLEGVKGAVLSQTLDTRLKELVRFQEKRIAVMVKFTERHRRLRQASESGGRQALTEPNLVPSRKKQKELDALARTLKRTLEDKTKYEFIIF